VPWAAAVLLIAFFVRLGLWQLDRAAEKRAIIATAAAAPELRWPIGSGQPPRFAHLRITGRFDPERHLLLDNQVLGGRHGVHVLTPLITPGGRLILVNRGWLPLHADRRLPAISTPAGEITITGRVNHWPTVGIQLGPADRLRPDRWPQRVTYLEPGAVTAAYSAALPDWLLQLEAAAPGGFAGRDAWPVVNFGPQRHLAYALTWFTLAMTVLAVSAGLGWRQWRSAISGTREQ